MFWFFSIIFGNLVITCFLKHSRKTKITDNYYSTLKNSSTSNVNDMVSNYIKNFFTITPIFSIHNRSSVHTMWLKSSESAHQKCFVLELHSRAEFLKSVLWKCAQISPWIGATTSSNNTAVELIIKETSSSGFGLERLNFRCFACCSFVIEYGKIPQIIPGLRCFKRPFRGAYIWKGLTHEGGGRGVFYTVPFLVSTESVQLSPIFPCW